MASDDNRARETVLWAAKHPLRIRILELAECEGASCLSASELKEALESEFEDLKTSQIAYHLAQLRDAGLLPRPER